MKISEMLVFWRSKPNMVESLVKELLETSTSSNLTPSFEFSRDKNTSNRCHHSFLLHVTSVANADSIIKNQKIGGVFHYTTFAQNLEQCLKQAESKGCVLIFEWQAAHASGSDGPGMIQSDTAYHHVGPCGYVETYISHRSKKQVKLIAIGLESDNPPYSKAYQLKMPINISVAN